MGIFAVFHTLPPWVFGAIEVDRGLLRCTAGKRNGSQLTGYLNRLRLCVLLLLTPPP
jgi:hypothetical protein